MGLMARLRAMGRLVAGDGPNALPDPDGAERLVNEGVALEIDGHLTEAMQRYDSALCLAPNMARAHLCRGNVLSASNDLEAARLAYCAALSIDPGYAAAHYNLGNTLVRLNQEQAALAAYRSATALKPDFADAEVALGVLLEELEQPDQALARYRRALQIQPDYVEVYLNLGGALERLGRADEAVAAYRSAIAVNQGFIQAYFHLSNTLVQLGRRDDAIQLYGELLAIQPEQMEAHNNLGNILKDCGRLEEAIACYSTALRLAPNSADVNNNLGTALEETGHLDDAVNHYIRALEINPDAATIHNNLGNALQGLGRYEEALKHYRRAADIGPDLADVRSNIGSALHRLGRFHEALTSYEQALAIDPRHAGTHNNMGTTLKDLEQFSDAIVSFRRALELDPTYEIAFHNLLFVLNYDPDKSAEEIYDCYREYELRFGAPHRGDWTPHENNPDATRRLRVGYVSPDFRVHACMFFLEPLLANHNHSVVEVYAYVELSMEDAATARYKTYVDHWIPTRGISDQALAQRIRSDQIDILVDLAGHTVGNRLGVFARKPAPVSLSWLGFGYTTGLSAVDYFLTDTTTAPGGSEDLFSEKLWRLDECSFAVYRPAQGMGEVSVLPALDRGHVTLGTLSRSVRINHRTVRVWAQILRRLPNARLVIDSGSFKDRTLQEATLRKFEAYGVERSRLEVGCHSPPWDVMRSIDIGLDCFPHNSGTTLFETLYMGIPYVTLAGRPSLGRLGSAILHGLGHTEWIASNEEEYIAKVLSLASDLPALARLRTSLRTQLRSSTLMDEPRFARCVESAYAKMYRTWIDGRQ